MHRLNDCYSAAGMTVIPKRHFLFAGERGMIMPVRTPFSYSGVFTKGIETSPHTSPFLVFRRAVLFCQIKRNLPMSFHCFCGTPLPCKSHTLWPAGQPAPAGRAPQPSAACGRLRRPALRALPPHQLPRTAPANNTPRIEKASHHGRLSLSQQKRRHHLRTSFSPPQGGGSVEGEPLRFPLCVKSGQRLEKL